MNNIIINESVITKLFENLRYDLIKAIAFILLFSAIMIFASSESEKYYPKDHHKSSIMGK